MTGAIIGALAGAFAVLLLRFSQKKAADKKAAENERKQPVRVEYKPKK